MSIKRKFENGITLCFSLFGLLGRVLFCNKVHFSPLTFVSLSARLKTYEKGLIKVGKLSAIKANTEICATHGKIIIGKQCFINRNCMIVSHEEITIGDGTTIGPNVCIYDHDHDGKGSYVSEPINIGKNVWIGAGCVLLKGISIGDDTIIGAGSVISKDIPTGKIVYQKRNTIVESQK